MSAPPVCPTCGTRKDGFLSPAQLAQQLGYSDPATVRQRMRDGLIPHVTDGRRYWHTPENRTQWSQLWQKAREHPDWGRVTRGRQAS